MSNEKTLPEQLAAVLKHAPEERHSYFQLKHFILGKERTPQGQMWQCLRELRSRYRDMTSLAMEIEDTKDNLRLLEIEGIKSTVWKRNVVPEVQHLLEEEMAIEVRKRDRKCASLRQTLDQLREKLRFIQQEALFFLEAFKAIESRHEMKDFDDFEAQKEYWDARIEERIRLKLLLQQPLDIELVETAMALPADSSVRVRVDEMLKRLEDRCRPKPAFNETINDGPAIIEH